MSTQLLSRNGTPGAVHSGQPARTMAVDPTFDTAALERIGTRVVMHRGQTVFHEGDATEAVYRVLSGAVRTSRLMADGRRYVADFLFPGDFVGLNDGPTRGMTADALCDAVLIRYPRSQFDRTLDADRGVGRMILAMLCGGLSSAQDRMLLLGRKTAAERVASFLLMMAERKGSERFELPMTREDIADYLGLTIETISRTISQFRAKNVIRTEGATMITIARRDALEDLAEAC